MSTGSTFDPQQALSQHVLKDFYVGGKWIKPQSDRMLELISPVTEECFLRVPEASEADVDHAWRFSHFSLKSARIDSGTAVGAPDSCNLIAVSPCFSRRARPLGPSKSTTKRSAPFGSWASGSIVTV